MSGTWEVHLFAAGASNSGVLKPTSDVDFECWMAQARKATSGPNFTKRVPVLCSFMKTPVKIASTGAANFPRRLNSGATRPLPQWAFQAICRQTVPRSKECN